MTIFHLSHVWWKWWLTYNINKQHRNARLHMDMQITLRLLQCEAQMRACASAAWWQTHIWPSVHRPMLRSDTASSSSFHCDTARRRSCGVAQIHTSCTASVRALVGPCPRISAGMHSAAPSMPAAKVYLCTHSDDRQQPQRRHSCASLQLSSSRSY